MEEASFRSTKHIRQPWRSPGGQPATAVKQNGAGEALSGRMGPGTTPEITHFTGQSKAKKWVTSLAKTLLYSVAGLLSKRA